MRFFPCNLRSAFGCAAMFTAIALAGCGDTCFSGFFDNGSGFIINTGNPPSCPLPKVNGKMRVAALKSPVCETCTAAARVEHIFVTMRGIQLRPSSVVDANSSEWVEIAPDLASKPRQIDLIGNAPEIFVEGAIVPAGSYSLVRLQFSSGSPPSGTEILSANACEQTGWNCIVRADGQVEPLRLPSDVPELLITLQSNESDSLVVLPDARMDLRLSLKPSQVFYSSGFEGLKLQYVLVGRAAVVWHESMEVANSTSN